MRGSPAFKDWLKTNLHLSAADMQTPESILVASSKALAAMRQTDPQHYKALRDYIGTSEQTILAMARPEFDVAYRQQKEFVKGLDGIAKKSVELYNDWVAATMHFKEALELISGPFMTAMDSAIKAADAWLTETRPAIEAFANSTARTVADIITKLGSIPFGRIANELFDGLQKGLAKINFDNVKTVLHEFMNWLVTGPLANAIIELVRRVGAASSGFLGAIGQTLAPGMGRVQAPGAPGSGGRFGHAGSYAGRASNDAATGDGRAITGVGTAASLTPAAGREGQITGVDKRLMELFSGGRRALAGRIRALRRALPFFSQKLAQGRGVEHRLRQQLLQLAVLVFECPQPFGIRDIHPAELGLPVVQRRFRHPVLPAEFPSLRASLMLPQHCDDLFFRKPASLHRSVPCSGRTLTPRGGISQLQVNRALRQASFLPPMSLVVLALAAVIPWRPWAVARRVACFVVVPFPRENLAAIQWLAFFAEAVTGLS